MDARQWQRVKSIFEEVIDLQGKQQRERLDTLCGQDAALRTHVEALIAADAAGEALLDQAPDQLADELFTEDTLPLPEYIGPYRVNKLIGRGGMGAVYKVHPREDSSQSLAVKVLYRDTYHTELVRRFKIEWQILSSLNHPNIAKLFDTVKVDNGRPYFAMEYIQGGSITSYCDSKKLSISDRLHLFVQVCSAAQHAHESQIIHRDIKPANVLVDAQGIPKLLDFGIAKVLDPDVLDTSVLLTQTGHRVLTLSYASPEQLRGKPLSISSDVYSLGVLLYELLTGHLPHNVSGRSRIEAEKMICETEPALMSETVHNGVQSPSSGTLTDFNTPQHLSELRSTSPLQLKQLLAGDLDVICQKALHKDITRRYASAEAFSKDITRYLNNESIHARPENIIYRSRTFAQRHKTRLSLSTAVVSLLIALSIFSSRVKTNTSADVGPAKALDTAPKTLVALPFIHHGSDQQDYFAEGVVDEITSFLSNIDGLRIISRNSAIKYKGSNKSAEAIGEVFNADYILRGSIEFNNVDDPKGRVQVFPQLVNVENDEVLWSSSFDETVSNIFDVQSIIALQVAEALNLTLLESDQLGMAKRITENLEAYNYFLRGSEFFRNTEDASSLQLAESMYRRATEKDTTFSKAYAELSKVHAATWFHRIDRSENRCNEAQKSAEKALIYDPQEPASYVALGMHAYRCRSNLVQAHDFFERALRINPNTIEALQGKAFLFRRQGKLKEALTFFKRMTELDPLGADYSAIALTHQLLRNYAEADSAYQLTIKYFPEEAHTAAIYARLNLAWKTPEHARKTMDSGTGSTLDNDFTRITSVYIDLVNKNYEAALNRVDVMGQKLFDTQVYYIPAAHLRARAFKGLNNPIEARKQETEALQLLTDYLKDHPSDSRAYATLGRVYAGLGQKEEALAAGLRSLELMPIQTDAIQGPLRVEDMAAIYVMVGEYEKAIDHLRILLANPGFVSAKLIETDPTWAPLRPMAAYRALIAEQDPASMR